MRVQTYFKREFDKKRENSGVLARFVLFLAGMPAKNKHEDKSERIDFRVCFNRRRNVCFLFYIESVGHGKQRYSAYNIMVVRVRKRSVADSGNRMFLRVPRKRRIRIYKLDKNRKTTGKFFRRRRTTVKRTRYFTQT